MSRKETYYRKKIISQIFFSQALSTTDLSQINGKSIPLVTDLVNQLVKDGFLEENGYAPSTGGRRPLLYSLSPGVFYIVAVAMDQLSTRIAILNSNNKFVTKTKKIDLTLNGNKDALQLLAKHIQEYIKNSGIDKEKILGIGIGMPGFVDIKKGINYTYLNTTTGTNFIKAIKDVVGKTIPVFIDNDSKLVALSELKWGTADQQNGLVINIGYSLGLGIIINGQIFKGHEGFAGEFGHIPLFTNQRLCSCGKTGCLETEASLLVVAKKAMEGLQNGKLSILKDSEAKTNEQIVSDVLDAALRGDRHTIEVLSEAGYHIGKGISVLIHLFNPEQIVLSGLGTTVGRIFLAPIQQAVNEHGIPMLSKAVKIELSTLGYNAPLLGAAGLVMQNFEELPLLDKKPARKKIKPA
jgi:predicted NBD/HSP70 family sugar kinase